MSLVTGITLPNNGDRIKVENYNDPITKILAQVNGNLDSANIAAGSLPWEAMASFTDKIPATAMKDSANLEKFRQESKISYIASGLIWSALSGLNAAMTTGFYYASTGIRLSVPAIASRAFLASRDTYTYVDSTGGIGYLDVANNAAQPALPSNANWLAKVVTSPSAITSVTDIRQTQLIAARNVDFTSGIWWEEIGHTTLSSPATSINVPITTKKHIRIMVFAEQAVSSASNVVYLRFNNDGGATQYARALSVTAPSGSSFVSSDTAGMTAVTNFNGDNINMDFLGSGLPLTSGSWNTFSGVGSTPADTRSGAFRWRGSTSITSVNLVNSITNGFKAGSTVVVLGHD